MEILALIIVGIWIVLNQIRRQIIIKDYMELQKKALELGKKISLKEFMLLEHSRTQNSLRIGIIALILGLAIFGVSFMDIPSTPNEPFKLVFQISGIIIIAFGIASLITWILIDKARGNKMQSVIEEDD